MKRITNRSLGRWYSRFDRHCGYCGAPVDAQRSTKHYCSSSCRVAALRARRIAERIRTADHTTP